MILRVYIWFLGVLSKLGVRTGENAENRDEGIH